MATLRALRQPAAAAAGGLALLTLIAALPLAPQGPFDARDYSRPAGMRLEFPGVGALVEPLAAPGHIVGGAPDFRVAGAVTLLWVVLGAAAWCLARELRASRRRPAPLIALRACGAAGVCAGVLLLLWAFDAFVRLPGWRLSVDDPNAIVADLHSHTLRSHDGIVSPLASLRWHASRGFSLVAITEHAAVATAPEGVPPVLLGVEVASERKGHLLALGLVPGVPLARPADDRGDPDFVARFVRGVHEEHGGAVIALNWKLTPQEVGALADLGVDGFEIANLGHPDLGPEVHEAMLGVSRSRGLALVAASDWHGWGGVARTWTVLRNPASRPLAPQQRAAFVVEQLRAHSAAAFVPVVAGYLGPPSPLRAIFSPVVETLRYAAELSPLRVLAWWVWVATLFTAAKGFARLTLRPRRVLLGALLLVLGAGLCLSGLSLLRAWAAGLTSTGFPAKVGAEALGLGAVSLALSAVLLARSRAGFRVILPRAASDPVGQRGHAWTSTP